MIASLADVVDAVVVAKDMAVDTEHTITIGLCEAKVSNSCALELQSDTNQRTEAVEIVRVEPVALAAAVRTPTSRLGVARDVAQDLDDGINGEDWGCNEGENGGESCKS